MAKISLLAMTKTVEISKVTDNNKFESSNILGEGEERKGYFKAQKIGIKMDSLPDQVAQNSCRNQSLHKTLK